MIDNISCLMWREETGTYAVTIKKDNTSTQKRGLTIKEALDLIETAVYMRYESGIEQ